MKNIGIKIVIAALAVSGPRFVLAFLVADGLKPDPWIEAVILTLTGIATGVVLTGGGAYIAHELIVMKGHWVARIFMVICWIALLISAVVILAPLMAVSLSRSDLAQVLNTAQLRWQWSIVAVVAVEILAAGAMVSHAVSGTEGQPQSKRRGSLSKLADAWIDATVAKLQQSSAAQPNLPAPSVSDSTQEVAKPETKVVAQPAHETSLPSAVLEAHNMRANGMRIADIAKKIRKSERTVNSYLKMAKAAQNGHDIHEEES